MGFTKVVPAGIGTEPGDGYRIGNSFLHAGGVQMGFGSTVGAINGITTYYGDGSQLTGVVASDNPLGNSAQATIFYEIDNATTISTTTTLSRTSGNPGKIYTKFQEVVVGTAPGTVELIVADGEEFVLDAYQLGVV